MINKDLEKTFHYPSCNTIGCNGVLEITFNDNFTINISCEKDENHNKKNIFYETFERFYLKEKKMENCLKCNKNLDNENIFACKECKNKYCVSCFMNDGHIKNNINNLNIKNNKCPIHEKELIYYCLNCKKLLCIYCLNQDKYDPHLNHYYYTLADMMPSINRINQLRHKINKKKLAYEKLQNLLDEWKKELIKKIEKLKQNLKKEIELLEKLFYNFNQNFTNFTYYNNYNIIFNNIKNFNSENLYNFILSESFEEKTKNLFDFLCPNNNQLINKNVYLEKLNYIGNGIISKISDNLFFTYNNCEYYIAINNYNINENALFKQKNGVLNFKDLIYSVLSFKKDDFIYIYACLIINKKIKIFIYNIKDDIIKISDEEIKDENNDDGDDINDANSFSSDNSYKNLNNNIFTKCIQLANQLIATSDNKNNIYIWKKDDSKGYINIKKIKLNYFINDLLLINDEYFIYSHSKAKTITFFNFKELNKEKIIDNIECVNTQNSLFLIKQFILINCKEGITILSLKTKEVVQFIEILKGIWEKKICFDKNNNIYILNHYNSLNIMKYKFLDGCLVEIKEYNEIDKQNSLSYSKDSNSNKTNIICVNEEDIIIWNNGIYILKK